MNLVILQPLEWFKENAYEDEVGDYWKSKEDANRCVQHAEPDNWYMSPSSIGKGIIDLDEYGPPKNCRKWCTLEKVTKENYPEYFL